MTLLGHDHVILTLRFAEAKGALDMELLAQAQGRISEAAELITTRERPSR